MTIDWTSLVFGIVLGSCVTSALVWYQRGTRAPTGGDPGYFPRLALSVVVTAALAGVIGSLVGPSMGVLGAGPFFGMGWLLGGLVAGWFVTAQMRVK
jgi:hypothetical protein